MPAVAEPPEPRALPLTAATKASPGIRSSRLLTRAITDALRARPVIGPTSPKQDPGWHWSISGEVPSGWRRCTAKRPSSTTYTSSGGAPSSTTTWPAGTSIVVAASANDARTGSGAWRRSASSARTSTSGRSVVDVSAAVAAARQRLGASAMASNGPARPRATSAPPSPSALSRTGAMAAPTRMAPTVSGVDDPEHAGEVGPRHRSLDEGDGDDLRDHARAAEEQHQEDGQRGSADDGQRRVGGPGDDDGDGQRPQRARPGGHAPVDDDGGERARARGPR